MDMKPLRRTWGRARSALSLRRPHRLSNGVWTFRISTLLLRITRSTGIVKLMSLYRLLAADWPEEILGHPGAAEETSYINDQQLYCGLRVRMGVHVGVPKLIRDPLSRRYEYAGPPVSLTAQITALAHGGQILLSGSAYAKVRSGPLVLEENRIQRIGDFDLPDQPQELSLYEVKIRDLEGRFFGGESLYQG